LKLSRQGRHNFNLEAAPGRGRALNSLPPVGSPAVSVVVPARNCAGTLPRTLAALAAQDYPGPVEVVVVDDCSDDDTAALAERAGVRVVRLDRQHGPAGARNAGIAATGAPLIAFTDADCAPAPGWLAAIVAALADADLVTGPVHPDPGVAVGPFDRTLHLTGPSPRFETANLAVRRAQAEAVGGFERFAPAAGGPGPQDGHFGEDAVFGWRVRRSGGRIAFAPAALVHHAVFGRGPRDYVAERWRLRFFPALVREIPELRGTLPGGVFLSPRSRRFDAALAGGALAVARRSAWPLAFAVPYARRDLRTWSPLTRGGLRENAVRVAADAVGLAALVRGSIAARRLLL
jgi:ABC-type amino acid transport substrate-binding protein